MRDPDGELAVVPKLLHGRASLRLVEQTTKLFDAGVGQTRGEYDVRALEAVMGDYRLGRCIEACLLTWYSFVQPGIGDLLTADELQLLEAAGLASPSALRLALWDAANARGGFVAPGERDAFLRDLAAEWGLAGNSEGIDRLVLLDREASAVLMLNGERPRAAEVVQLYNRGVVKTLLAHSTDVQFRLGSLPGEALRKVYFIAKRSGVLVDIEKADPGGFVLTLYGPEQAFGTAEKYGRRLANVSLTLLRSLLSIAPDAAMHGTASLILHDRPYRFHLTGEVLERLEYAPAPSEREAIYRLAEREAAYSVGSAVDVDIREDEEASEPSFDSLIEAALYRSFKSLEKQGYTHGWRIQREPDPLLADPGIVLIPDFAFVRGQRRVFMEVAGFWSASYREKKLSKLRALANDHADTAFILAVPLEAAATFSGLPFPTIAYKKDVRATDLLDLLNRHFGEREERQEAAQLHFVVLRQQAEERGYVPEREIASTLQAYSRTELLAVASNLGGPDCLYIAGVGLLSTGIIERIRVALEQALDASLNGRMPLDDAGSVAAQCLQAAPGAIEALVQLWPEFQIERPSLFDSFLRRA